MNIYYHNPKCSKSRAGLEYLQNSNLEFQTKEYLKEPLTTSELDTVFAKLNKEPSAVVRKKEAIYKELNLSEKDLSRSEWLDTIKSHPSLLERPILVTKESAVIGRPTKDLIRFVDSIA